MPVPSLRAFMACNENTKQFVFLENWFVLFRFKQRGNLREYTRTWYWLHSNKINFPSVWKHKHSLVECARTQTHSLSLYIYIYIYITNVGKMCIEFCVMFHHTKWSKWHCRCICITLVGRWMKYLYGALVERQSHCIVENSVLGDHFLGSLSTKVTCMKLAYF